MIGAAAVRVRVTSSSVASAPSVGASSAAVPGLHVAETTADLFQLQLLIIEKPLLPVHHLKRFSDPSVLLLRRRLLLVSLLASVTPARLASSMPRLHRRNVAPCRESRHLFVLFLCLLVRRDGSFLPLFRALCSSLRSG